MNSTPHEDAPQRKRRTRAHVFEDLSENFLEKKVLARGHVLQRPKRDYGIDVVMFHFAADGEVEIGKVRFQLKATDHLTFVELGRHISVKLYVGDLGYWAYEFYPVILVVFDAVSEKAFWLDIQEYVDANPDVLDPEKKTVNIRIPVSNRLTLRSVDLFRQKSLLASRRGHPNKVQLMPHEDPNDITFDALKSFLLRLGFDEQGVVKKSVVLRHPDPDTLIALRIPDDGRTVHPADLLSVEFRLDYNGFLNEAGLQQLRAGKLPMAS